MKDACRGLLRYLETEHVNHICIVDVDFTSHENKSSGQWEDAKASNYTGELRAIKDRDRSASCSLNESTQWNRQQLMVGRKSSQALQQTSALDNDINQKFNIEGDQI